MADDTFLRDLLEAETAAERGEDAIPAVREALLRFLRYVRADASGGRAKGPLGVVLASHVKRAEELKERRRAGPTTATTAAAAAATTVVEDGNDVNLSDLVGVDAILREYELGQTTRAVFGGSKATTATNVLLFGPPGTGKTTVAKAIAKSQNMRFYNVVANQVLGMYVGDNEKNVAGVFDAAKSCGARAMIFVDEIDGLCADRKGASESANRLKGVFLQQIDSCAHTDVVVVGATNRPGDLDEAFRRRFESRIYVALPTRETRAALFARVVSGISADDPLVAATEGFSNADVDTVIKTARKNVVRAVVDATAFFRDDRGVFFIDERPGTTRVDACYRDLGSAAVEFPPLDHTKLMEAAKSIRPSVSADDVRKVEEFDREFGGGF
jgi:SpoVK/Ycf46/Vps4 family AAA+-type ATPase